MLMLGVDLVDELNPVFIEFDIHQEQYNHKYSCRFINYTELCRLKRCLNPRLY